MLYCLDTNIVIDLLRGDKRLQATIESCIREKIGFCMTPIALAELFKGAYLAARQKDALRLVEDFVHSVELLNFTEQACKLFGYFHAELRKQGKQTQDADLMIGSIALAHDAALVTRNGKDFKNIAGLKIIEW